MADPKESDERRDAALRRMLATRKPNQTKPHRVEPMPEEKPADVGRSRARPRLGAGKDK